MAIELTVEIGSADLVMFSNVSVVAYLFQARDCVGRCFCIRHRERDWCLRGVEGVSWECESKLKFSMN